MAQALEAMMDSCINTAYTHHITIPLIPSTITHARTFCRTAIVDLLRPVTRRATTEMRMPAYSTTTTMDPTILTVFAGAAALLAAYMRLINHSFSTLGGSGPQF